MGDRLATIHMAENWRAAVPLSGTGVELGANLTQCRLTEAYLFTKWHLDPSNRLATAHQRYNTDRQRCDSIERTVLQAVAQKWSFVVNRRSNKMLSPRNSATRYVKPWFHVKTKLF